MSNLLNRDKDIVDYENNGKIFYRKYSKGRTQFRYFSGLFCGKRITQKKIMRQENYEKEITRLKNLSLINNKTLSLNNNK